jgi:hypothetical protein
MNPKTKIPMLVFWDFATAFPSVAHAFIFIAFQAAGFPPEAIAFARALYIDTNAHVVCEGAHSLHVFGFPGGIAGSPP